MENPSLLILSQNIFSLNDKLYSAVAKKFNLQNIDVRIICYVFYCSKNVTASNIVRQQNIKKNTMSVHIDWLVKSGYLVRTENQDDRRQLCICLTDKAKVVANECKKHIDHLKARLTDGISKKQLTELNLLFEKTNKNAQKLLAEEFYV